MFDKDLFFSLCEKYNVELSETADQPMIRDGIEIRAITENEVNRIFVPYQTYFDYFNSTITANVNVPKFYLQDDYAIAC